MSFSEKVKAVRAELMLTQKELAKELGFFRYGQSLGIPRN